MEEAMDWAKDRSVDAYLKSSTAALRTSTNFDPATLNLFVLELELHIGSLCDDFIAHGHSREAAIQMAIAMMADPNELADAAEASDRIAFETAPASWWRSHLKNLWTYYSLPMVIAKGIGVALIIIPLSLLFLQLVPESIQTYFIVPLNAFAIGILVYLFGLEYGRPITKSSLIKVLNWSALIATGATSATYITEYVAGLPIPYKTGIAYAVISSVLALTITVAYWATYALERRIRFRTIFRFFVSLALSFWLLALVIWTGFGRNHVLMFIGFVVAATFGTILFAKYLNAQNEIDFFVERTSVDK